MPTAAAMLTFAPIPLHRDCRDQDRARHDYYVCFDTHDYALDPTAIDQAAIAADFKRVRVAQNPELWASTPVPEPWDLPSPTRPTSMTRPDCTTSSNSRTPRCRR